MKLFGWSGYYENDIYGMVYGVVVEENIKEARKTVVKQMSVKKVSELFIISDIFEISFDIAQSFEISFDIAQRGVVCIGSYYE